MTRTVLFGDLHLEHHHWKNPRTLTGLSDKEIAVFAADIKAVKASSEDPKASGFVTPLTVVKVKSNGGVIDLAIDGQRRVMAGKHNNLPKNTPIEVVDLIGWEEPIELTPEKSDELTAVVMRMFNREGLSSFEISEVVQRMRDRGKQMAEIATHVHKSESWVSRILKARAAASPKLMLAWQKGEITDEQFKDLASQKDAERQSKDTEEVIEARKAGDKEGARTKAKEIVETAKQKAAREKAEKKAAKEAEAAAKKAAKESAKVKAKPVNKEAVLDHERERLKDLAAKHNEKPVKPQSTPRAMLEDIVKLSDGRPPTHDYVKGVIGGVRYALGLISTDDLAKPFKQWVERAFAAGLSRAADQPSKRFRALPKSKAKAKAKAKVKARKPAKKAPKRKR